MTKPAKVNRGAVPRMSSLSGMGGSTPIPDLDDLGDVNAPSPSDGDTLIWDDGAGEWVPGSPLAGANLDDLADVDVPSPADGDALIWDAGAGMWVAGPGSGPAASGCWRPVTVNNPSIVTTDGEPVYVPLVDGFGNAVMTFV